ncbi:MAG: tRNA pseudouridine32 synthase/23S rRNA pseudouridine746 synthase [Gammaproteobacteria bacterium]
MPSNEFHIDITEADLLPATVLAQASELSIGQLKKIMQKGAVWLSDEHGTHRLRRAKKPLKPGSSLHFYYNPEVLDAEVPVPALIADEGDYSIWVKPRGLLSQGSKWGDHHAIDRWIATHDEKQRPAFIVHRLDRAAIGIMLIAHGKKTAAKLAEAFARKQITKTYRAAVTGEYPESIYPITITTPVAEKAATSHFRRLFYDAKNKQSWLSIKIESGRKHQIRIHLNEQGFPVVGDRLYGNDDSENLQLYAAQLAFECPISQQPKHYSLPASFLPNHWDPDTTTKIIAPPTQV